MFTLNRILMLLGSLLVLTSTASAFFLSWGAPEQKPVPNYYDYQRRIQNPGYGVPISEASAPIPMAAIPVQVPMPAQLSPAASIHNVQLVPCLCPVSQEVEYENIPHESVFINAQNNKNKKN